MGNPSVRLKEMFLTLSYADSMAVFGEHAIRQSTKITVNVNGNKFHLGGVKTLKTGWIRLYEPYDQIKDVLLPALSADAKSDC